MPRLEKEAIDATEREAERSEEWTEGEHSNNLNFFGRNHHEDIKPIADYDGLRIFHNSMCGLKLKPARWLVASGKKWLKY
jgi:hypothetical protein